MCILIVRTWPNCNHMRCTSTGKCHNLLSTPGMHEYDCPSAETIYPDTVPDWPCPVCEALRREFFQRSGSPSPEAASSVSGSTGTISSQSARTPTLSDFSSAADTPAWVEEWAQCEDAEVEEYRYGMGGAGPSSQGAHLERIAEEDQRGVVRDSDTVADEDVEGRIEGYRYGAGIAADGEDDESEAALVDALRRELASGGGI